MHTNLENQDEISYQEEISVHFDHGYQLVSARFDVEAPSGPHVRLLEQYWRPSCEVRNL